MRIWCRETFPNRKLDKDLEQYWHDYYDGKILANRTWLDRLLRRPAKPILFPKQWPPLYDEDDKG
jgi:hypothetical protein